MAAIALIRSVGILLPDVYRALLARLSGLPQCLVNLFGCIFIWMLAFIIISPAVFELKVGGFIFGSYGWDKVNGFCQTVVVQDEGQKGGGVITAYGVLFSSYIALGLFVKREIREIRAGLEPNDCQVIISNIKRYLTKEF